MDARSGPDEPYVERPRIVDVDADRLADGLLVISFSVPIAYSTPKVAITLIRANNTGPVTANCAIGGPRSTALICKFSGGGRNDVLVDAILLPRKIVRRDGQRAPITLWGGTDGRLRFAE